MPAKVVQIFDVGDYGASISEAVEKLRGGGLVVLPTETVYGTAAAIQNQQALDRLRALRGGDDKRPFTIHLANREQAQRFVGRVNDFAQRLMRKLWPGPVGLCFDVPQEQRTRAARELGVPENSLYDNGVATLRCPDHIVVTDVISRLGGAAAMIMAGSRPHSHGDTLESDLKDQVDLILSAGPTRYGKPSTIVKVEQDRYRILRAGVYDERIIDRLLRTTILFVCSGNTCRSPMAEALAKATLARKLNVAPDDLEKKGIVVISAGSLAIPGAKATPQAVEAVKNLGADLSRHRSQPLSVELIHQADIIFTMSRAHAAAVMALVPTAAAEKTVTLNPEGDIEDPIGGDLSLYQELAGKIQQLLEKRLEETVAV